MGICLALEDKTEQVFRAVVPVIPLLSSEHSSFSTSLSKLDMISLYILASDVVY